MKKILLVDDKATIGRVCNMPHMRGNEFLYYLKDNELLKHIPVVMLSSEESTTERIQLLEAGAVDYILKPFNPLELKARIKKYI